MFQNVTLDTDVDNAKTSAVHIDSMVTGLGLYVPVLNDTAKVSIEIYVGDNPPPSYRATDAVLAADADTDWVTVAKELTSAGIAGPSFIPITDSHSFADSWIRFMCDASQAPGVGEPSELTFKLLARREK